MSFLPKRNPRSTTRMTIDVQQNFAEMLEKLAAKDGISKAEAVRKAVIIYNRLREVIDGQSGRALAISKDGKVDREFILP